MGLLRDWILSGEGVAKLVLCHYKQAKEAATPREPESPTTPCEPESPTSIYGM